LIDQQHNDEFESFLAGESELSDRYAELGHEQPPPEIDARILAEARRAAKLRKIRFGPRGGWLKPVALAATVLLSLSIVLNIIMEAPIRYEPAISESIEAEPATPARKALRATPEKPAGAPVRGQAMADDEMAETMPRSTGQITAAQKPLAEQPGVGRPGPGKDAALLIVAGYVAALDSGQADTKGFALMEKARRTQSAAERVAEPDTTTEDQRRADGNPGANLAANPDAMLLEIDRLSSGGAITEAHDRLDQFLHRFPDHPVSKKIRQLEQ
jgi:hypothetical protein